ncbi:tetratricopeptide repeat protein [Dactylosporangium sp. NPDC050688]|uniref:ATP-binding protein n=1 Tax=Dactylosporangium sp. NPDC050688 TaxID=3157217 RepID=UPI0033D971C7
MTQGPDEQLLDTAAVAVTTSQMAALLRTLRRRHARHRRDRELTYREIASRTGWSTTAVAEYFTGHTLAPTDRLDALVCLLGATSAEQGALATARDRIDEHRRNGSPAAPVTARPVLRQLPPPPRHFSGRAEELACLDRLVDDAKAAGVVAIAAIDGAAGVGKTTLAAHWAHRTAELYPDGQLYVDLRGFDPSGRAVTAAHALRSFLSALGVPDSQVPAGEDAAAALYRSVLAGRRVSILLDNAYDSAHVRPLLPATATCTAVVTSRNRLTGLVALDGAHPITLGPLPHAAAHIVFATRIGDGRVEAEPAATAAIVGLCAGLPLALGVAAARAATNPHTPLQALAAELSAARLDALTGDDPRSDTRAVFSWSYHALTAAAARLFRLLGLHPGTPISVAAAASLAAASVTAGGAALAELVQGNLLSRRGADRYVMHDLFHWYAAELVRDTEPDDAREAATCRLLRHYLHTAHAAAYPAEPALQVLPQGVVAGDPGDDASAWFAAEHTALLRAVDIAVAHGHDAITWQLAEKLGDYLDRRGHWNDLASIQQAALTAARRLGEPLKEAGAHRHLARAYLRLGDNGQARTHLGAALELAQRHGDRHAEGRTWLSLALLSEREGRLDAARDHARHALGICVEMEDRPGQARALNAVGWYQALLGEYADALAHCERSVTLAAEVDDPICQANAWHSFGYSHHRLGDYHQALTCYHQALGRFRQAGDDHLAGLILTDLGDAHSCLGETAAADEAWREALALLDNVRHPDAEKVRARLAH